MDSADIGVVEGRRSAGFATEPLQRRWLESQVFRKKLNGNQAAEFGVLSLVDNTHSTTTKLLDDAVVRDGLANHSKETPIQAARRFSDKPFEMGFPGFLGAGLRRDDTPKVYYRRRNQDSVPKALLYCDS
jgi:hypothetical protein